MVRAAWIRVFVLSSSLVCSLGFSTSVVAAGDAQNEKPKEQSPTKFSRPAEGGETKIDGDKVILTGITLTVPASWKSQPVAAPGPMAPKAVFTIPGESEASAGSVRITHYPEMKGKDDLNIDRWLSQVTQADGKPSKRDQAKMETIEAGEVKITLLELSGSVKMTMRDEPHPGYRMLAAIVNHPKGPHFIVAAGPEDLMTKQREQVIGFLKSAKVN